MRLKTLLAVGSACALAGSAPARGSTFRYLSFSERVARADLIVRGTVVEVEGFQRESVGPTVAAAAAQKESASPRAARPADQAATAVAARPVGVPVEGGSMIFTRVKLSVDEEIYGAVGSQLVLELAGGTYGDRALTIHGMPGFVKGKTYLLLLRRGYETAGDPVVGVNQGFFEIAKDPGTGEEILLDSSGDVVVGVADDGVVVKRRTTRAAARPQPRLVGGPTPDEATSPVRPDPSPDVLRYWRSSDPPMAPEAFVAALRAAKGVQR